MIRRAAVLLALTLAFAPAGRAQAPADFSRMVARLSEPGGFFDSDNLVSNETSYLHVLGPMRSIGVRGGAYIGVGPEQGFSYIAAIEPEIALMIDIRRDNLLLHLLFKAMFEAADTRIEYLGLLFGRPAPADATTWRALDLSALLSWIDGQHFDSVFYERTHQALMQRVERFGVPMSNDDRITLKRFHDDFARGGLDLTFASLGRPSRRAYPTVRRLYLETDLDGNAMSYLSTEERWRRVQRLQRAGRVIPVIGDLAGPRAVRAIGDYLRETRRGVSALYVSNVEMYLFRAGTFSTFAANVRTLPAGPNSVIIRSWFNRGAVHPGSQPGHFSTQVLQTWQRFLTLTAPPDTASYWTIATDGLEPRGPVVWPQR